MRCFLLLFFVFYATISRSQVPDHIYASNIKSIKCNVFGNPLAYAVWKLNSGDQVELHFDDINGGVRNYSYTYQLYNADWTPAMLNQLDYLSGFSQMRLSNYRVSSLARTKYTHYQATLPERNCMPTRSGNYLIKVFAKGVLLGGTKRKWTRAKSACHNGFTLSVTSL